MTVYLHADSSKFIVSLAFLLLRLASLLFAAKLLSLVHKHLLADSRVLLVRINIEFSAANLALFQLRLCPTLCVICFLRKGPNLTLLFVDISFEFVGQPLRLLKIYLFEGKLSNFLFWFLEIVYLFETH